MAIKPRSALARKLAFMGTQSAKTPKGADLAIFGAPHGTPYKTIDNRVHEKSPDAFRRVLKADANWLSHWDWDFAGPLLPEGFKAVDLGNLATKTKDGRNNRNKIRNATMAILEAGAVPIMLGGDDSTPIPFIEGFAGSPPITILQIDAHIDWRHEREKETMGFSSTMRRASEQTHVWRIVQAGARGLGSARFQEVQDARDWGVHFVTAKHIHHHGTASVLDHIEPDSHCVICLDLDVLDVSIMPAVAYPSPGGLAFQQLTDLIEGVAAKAHIAGFAMVEFVPKRDLANTAAFTAARLVCHAMARSARNKRPS